MTERPKMPASQIVYGEIVYWLCVVSAIICMLGPVYAMIDVDNNVINTHYLFSAIWDGKDALSVWTIKGGEFPGGHFWLSNISKGDGLTQFGLVLGGSVALPALLGAMVCFLVEKPRQWLWAGLSLWVACLIFISASGAINAGH